MQTNNLIQTRGQYLKISRGKVPQKNEVYDFVDEIIGYLFPILSNNYIQENEKDLDEVMLLLNRILKSYDSGLVNIKSTIKKIE